VVTIKVSKPAMVLIDVDGTLVDSVPDLAYCVDEMMKAIGRDACGEAKVRNWVGNGVERLVKRALTGEMESEPDAADYERALPIFLSLYADNVSQRSVLYPGVREGLDYMKGAGYKMGCVTNKASQFTIPLLKDLGVHDQFEIIICGDTLSKKKPDPMPLLHAAQHFAVAPNQALMLGDSISDVKAARAAGFNIICMSYGYNHGEDIRNYQPDAVIDSMAELRHII